MTELVERFRIDVSIKHDQNSKLYMGTWDAREQLKQVWPLLIGLLDSHTKGVIDTTGYRIEFDAPGLEEVPELTGGDN